MYQKILQQPLTFGEEIQDIELIAPSDYGEDGLDDDLDQEWEIVHQNEEVCPFPLFREQIHEFE